MKNKTLRLKNILCVAGIVLLMTTSANSQLVFSTNFDGEAFGHQQPNGSLFGGPTPQIGFESFFAASNGAAITDNGDAAGNDELQLTNFNTSKSRGAGVWLDSSTWAVGTVTVEFDVLDYAPGGVDSESFFQVYSADGVDAINGVNIDLHGAGGLDPIAAPQAGSTATIGAIGPKNLITADATAASFTFNFTGQANIALVFHNKSAATDTAQPVYSVDNLTVTVSGSTGTLLGDVDLSGEVDFLDIAPFIAILSGGLFQAEADCDENGEVTFLDIAPFIAILSGM